MRRLLVLGLAALAAGGLSARAAQNPPAAASGRNVWGGVYTDAQAARGEARYRATCSGCHDEGPRRGEAFMRDWAGSDVASLFGQIRKAMPPGSPGSLADSEYLDIVAYMLRVNGFPAGLDALTADAAVRTRIEGPNGPEPVPNFALARLVGCLTAGPGADWTLTHAGVPVRTRNPAASTGEERAASDASTLGSQTIRLMNVYPRPEAYAGHRVEAKGFLIRDPAGDRINATAVQTLAPRCP